MPKEKKYQNLVVFFSSLQTPAPEISINYFLKNRKKFEKIYFVESFNNSPLRIDLTFIHGSFRKLVSSIIRNGPLKYFKYKHNINKILKKYVIDYSVFKKNKHIKKKELEFNFDYEEFKILKKYFCQFSGFSFLRKLNKKKVNIFLATIDWSKKNTLEFLKNKKIDSKNTLFLIHNGYHPIEYGIKNALKKFNCLYTETNTYVKTYLIRKNGFHDLETFDKEILEFYNNIKINQKENLILKKSKEIMNFKGNNDLNIKMFKNRILFLTSSINEFDYTYDKPTNQLKIILKLLESEEFSKNHELIVRVHPNTRSYSNENQNVWKILKEKYPDNIILFDEQKNTYDLIKSSSVTMSIGSVTGLEGILMDRPHIMFGYQSMWSKIKVAKILNENSSVKNIIKNINLLKIKNVTYEQKLKAACSYIYEYCYGDKFLYPLWSKFPYHLNQNQKIFFNNMLKDIS